MSAFLRVMEGFYKQVVTLVLWLLVVSNLTAFAQIRIKDIRPGIESSSPEQLTSINGTLYFVADDGVHGKELWKSDGTTAGTVLVKDIIPGVVSGKVQNLTNVNGTVFLSATNPTVVNQFGGATKLWKSTGTEAGTVELSDGIGNPLESINPSNLTNIGGLLYYTNKLALGGNSNSGLLTSDGTNSPGTKIIAQLPIQSPRFSSPAQLTDLNGTLYFMYEGGLWKSNGASATAVKKMISPGPEDSKIQGLINVNGTMFFSADDGQSSGVRRLWKSDGTDAGTVKLLDGISNPAEGPNPTNLTNVNGTLYYTSSIAKGGYSYWGLFKSDGSNHPGTAFFGTFIKSSNDVPLSSFNIPYGSSASQAASPSNLMDVNGTLYFVFAGNLWKSDGTLAGTEKVTNALTPSYLTNVNGTLYFVSSQGSIYKTDPSSTTASSVVVSLDPTYNLTNVNGTLFYTHNDPATSGTELYKVGLTRFVAVLCQEAESATGTGTTLVSRKALGFKYRSCFGTKAEYIEYSLSVIMAGNYTLHLRCGSSRNAIAGVQVNGDLVKELVIGNTGGLTAFVDRTLVVYLKAGANKIRVQGSRGGCFSQDKLCIGNTFKIGSPKAVVSP